MTNKQIVLIIVAYLLSIVTCAYFNQSEIAFGLMILGYIFIERL